MLRRFMRLLRAGWKLMKPEPIEPEPMFGKAPKTAWDVARDTFWIWFPSTFAFLVFQIIMWWWRS